MKGARDRRDRPQFYMKNHNKTNDKRVSTKHKLDQVTNFYCDAVWFLINPGSTTKNGRHLNQEASNQNSFQPKLESDTHVRAYRCCKNKWCAYLVQLAIVRSNSSQLKKEIHKQNQANPLNKNETNSTNYILKIKQITAFLIWTNWKQTAKEITTQ